MEKSAYPVRQSQSDPPIVTSSYCDKAYLRLDNDVQRSGRRCRPHCRWAQRASKVKERIGSGHGEQVYRTMPGSSLVLGLSLSQLEIEIVPVVGGGVSFCS